MAAKARVHMAGDLSEEMGPVPITIKAPTDPATLLSVIVVTVNHHFQFSNPPYKTTRIDHGYKNIQIDQALADLVSANLRAYLDGHQGCILLAVRSP